MLASLNSAQRAFALAALIALTGGCASRKELVVLIPEKDGKDAAVVVTSNNNVAVLDYPYAAVAITPSEQRPYSSNAEEVSTLFGAALAAQPQRPVAFTLYFMSGKDEFTDESKKIAEEVFSEIERRAVPDILVVGHTDAVGSDRFNDAMSLQRAQAVRAQLIRRGVHPENIQAIGRGKRELLVPTPDGVAEPRNARVELFVR